MHRDNPFYHNRNSQFLVFLTYEVKFLAFLTITKTINVYESVYDMTQVDYNIWLIIKCHFTIRDIVCCLNSVNGIENYGGKENKWLSLVSLLWFLCGSLSSQAQTITSINWLKLVFDRDFARPFCFVLEQLIKLQ